jgi:hypothetical protein
MANLRILEVYFFIFYLNKENTAYKESIATEYAVD